MVGSLPLSPAWLIEGNLTWMDATQQTGADRPYRPEQTARLSLMWQRDDWSANLTARHTGEATDPFLTKIDNTFTLELTARWSVTPTLSLEARVLNLTDNTDQQLPGYRVPGTTAFLGTRISL